MNKQFAKRELRLFLALALAGVAAALHHVHIPHTEVLIDGRWAFGFMGFALLRHWWSALALAVLLSYPYGSPSIPLWIGFVGNMLYAVPSLLTLRPAATGMLRRWGPGCRFGLGWLALVLLCYQVFITPVVWGVSALLAGRSATAGVLAGWRTQPLLVESLLVALFSAAGMVAILAVERLRTQGLRLEHMNRVLLGIRNVNQLIVTENDPQRLIEQACVNLTETMGYPTAWIALLGGEPARRLGLPHSGPVAVAATAGLVDSNAEALRQRLERGELPHCATQALENNDGPEVRDPAIDCADCPLNDEYGGRKGLARRLEFDGVTYGILSASMPAAYAQDTAGQELFEEVAGDIAFALHRIGIERELTESHRRYCEIFEGSRDGFVMVNAEGRFLDANQAYCDMLGYSLEELRAMESFYAVTPEHWREWERREIWEKRLVAEGASGLYEKEYRRKNGTVFPVELQSYAVRDSDGRLEFLWGAVRDITERKRAERALIESDVRFRKLLADLPVLAVQGYLTDGTTIYWNKGSENLYGYSAGEAIGTNLLDLIIPPDMKDTVKRAIKEMTDTGTPRPPEEMQLQRKDGTLVPVFSSHVVLTRAEHAPELYCLDMDLTDVKEAEKERQRLQEQLAQAQKMESIGRLAGGVAHDFNNMIMGVMNYVELCRDHIDADHPVSEWLDEITHEAKRSANLTRQLLAFARKQTIAPKVLDLNDALTGMLKLIRQLIGEDIDLAWSPGTGLWPVKIDPGQLDQLLANLCVNARDAIDGVGKVTIETANVTVDADYCAAHAEATPGPYVVLAVSDDGCGMDPDILAHVFEPFFTTKPTDEGTGLGLATVYGVVKQNDGFVNVYSEPGHGATFRIYLPAVAGRTAEPPSAETTNEEPGGPETILLVEDSKSVRVTTAKFLQRLGYAVLAAERPAEALRLAEEHDGSIDLLITDVVLPGMSGRDLAARLTEEQPEIATLYISGYTANVIAHRGILDADVQFLAKPFTRDDLAHKVRSILDA